MDSFVSSSNPLVGVGGGVFNSGASVSGGGGGGGASLGMKRALGSRANQKDSDKWVLIAGLQSSGHEHDILKHFHKFGDIDEYSTGGSRGNWVFIK